MGALLSCLGCFGASDEEPSTTNSVSNEEPSNTSFVPDEQPSTTSSLNVSSVEACLGCGFVPSMDKDIRRATSEETSSSSSSVHDSFSTNRRESIGDNFTPSEIQQNPDSGVETTEEGAERYFSVPVFGDEDECPTCLEEYDEENPRITVKCLHHFHLACIYEWMEISPNCPVCREVLLLDD